MEKIGECLDFQQSIICSRRHPRCRLPRSGGYVIDRCARIRKSSTRFSLVKPLPPEPEFTYTLPEPLQQLPGFHK